MDAPAAPPEAPKKAPAKRAPPKKQAKKLSPSKKKAEQAKRERSAEGKAAQQQRVREMLMQPLSAFMLFGFSQRGILKKQKAPIREVVRAVGERWLLLSDAERAKYEAMAEEDQRRAAMAALRAAEEPEQQAEAEAEEEEEEEEEEEGRGSGEGLRGTEQAAADEEDEEGDGESGPAGMVGVKV